MKIFEKLKDNKEGMLIIFLAVTISLELVYWIIMVLSRGAFIENYFSNDFNDTAMDYFSMMAEMADNNPYKHFANYPPLVFVILKVFKRICPGLIDLSNGKALRVFMPAQLSYIILSVFCIVSVYELVKQYLKTKYSEKCKIMLGVAVLLSGPFLFALERGNFILLSLVFLLLYLKLYDSDKRWLRIISYIFLALAAGIKVYLAVFGLLILYKKKFKEAIIAVLIGIFFVVGPFFVFNGFSDIHQMFQGISISSSEYYGSGYNYSLKNLINIIMYIAGKEHEIPSIIIFAVAFGLNLLLSIIAKKRWQKVFFLTMMCIMTPAFSYTYTLVLLVPALLLYLLEEDKIGYLFYGILVIIPLALPTFPKEQFVKFPLTWVTLITNASLYTIYSFVVVISLHDFYKKGIFGKGE